MLSNVLVAFLVCTLSANLVPEADGYGFSYNYLDEMAQSYCASRITEAAWTFAVRRDCKGVAPKCNDICKNAKNEILKKISNERTQVACYDAFQLRKDHENLQINPSDAQPDAGKVNMYSYSYGLGGCTWRENHCGPNYCCCKAY